MMKKQEQRAINELAEAVYFNALDALECEYGLDWEHNAPCRRLRSCQARVYETMCYYVLKSYNTLVAVIDKDTNKLYDVLRTVYGYTATSAQHIAKFRSDYGSYRAETYTTRYV